MNPRNAILRPLLVILMLAGASAGAALTGTVRGPEGQPLVGVTVRLDDGSETTTGPDGSYRLDVKDGGPHQLTAVCDGFLAVLKTVDTAAATDTDLQFTQLAPSRQSVVVTADVSNDALRNPDPGQRVQIRDEMLDANPGRPGAPVSVPGLPAETASGGIKAPQYFAPGVAGDHGEPIAQFFQVGGYLLPNNLSANAHGNGYADPNMIVPAVIESVATDGGAFNVGEGNHSVNLGVTYGFAPRLASFVTITGDPHDADIAAGWSPARPQTRAWIAIEIAAGDGLLKLPEHRRQYKVNGYRVFEMGRHQVTLLGIGYYGSSRLPGLVPTDAASLHDTIDPRQHDQTHTGEIAANDIWHIGPSTDLQFSGFFRTYNLSLLSNFGDGLIRQSEFRTAAGGQTAYTRQLGRSISILAGMDYSREAPRRLDLDRYDSADPLAAGPFRKVTANDVTLNLLSPYVAMSVRWHSWLRVYLGWRRDAIHFDNVDLLTPDHSFHRWVAVDSPKATVSLVPHESSPLPTLSFSFGQAFFTNDPRTGSGQISGSLVSRAHSWQTFLEKTVLGVNLRATLGLTTQEQSLAKIDPDTGLQFDQGPSRNRYVTASASRRFAAGLIAASFSRADARDLSSGLPVPEAPRSIYDVLGTIDRLPWRLVARGEFEMVGPKPLGDGFVATPVREWRGALTRPFWKGRADVGLNLQIARGYSGQTTEVLSLAGEGDPFERVVGVRIASYAAVSVRLHL